jgi:ElaB/YqjD/DUF883 family membrane-anchored ribosome-binding protein
MTGECQKHDISSAAQKIHDGAMDMKAAVVERGNAALHQACCGTEATIKANPYTSLLVALGVGVVIGAVILRR